MSRSEFVTTFNNYFGPTNKTGKVFSDTLNHQAKDSIEAILESEIMHRYKDNSFRPKNYSTRAEVVNSLNQVNKNDFEISTDKVDNLL